jgi:hypothetical protein
MEEVKEELINKTRRILMMMKKLKVFDVENTVENKKFLESLLKNSIKNIRILNKFNSNRLKEIILKEIDLAHYLLESLAEDLDSMRIKRNCIEYLLQIKKKVESSIEDYVFIE